MIRTAFAALAIAAAFICQSAAASTVNYSNEAAPATGGVAFGIPGSTFGEVFTAPGDTLESFSFLMSVPNGGNVRFGIAQWGGDHAIAPELYSSGPFALTLTGFNMFEWQTISGINVSLTVGTKYIAFLTTSGIGPHTHDGTAVFTADDGGLPGYATRLFSEGAGPVGYVGLFTWDPPSDSHIVYRATFSGVVPPTPTPIPATLPLLASALCGLGGLACWRNRKKA